MDVTKERMDLANKILWKFTMDGYRSNHTSVYVDRPEIWVRGGFPVASDICHIVLIKAQYEAVDHLLVLNRQIDPQITEELNEFAPRDTSRYRI